MCCAKHFGQGTLSNVQDLLLSIPCVVKTSPWQVALHKSLRDWRHHSHVTELPIEVNGNLSCFGAWELISVHSTSSGCKIASSNCIY